ncbi:MAG: RNA polymerase sigma factor [Bryobacterales bacterium]|nr:RNA polymerase sigma factor [Bryobacterales bacterium]
MQSPTTTFLLLEQAKAGDNPALSRAFERTRRRLAVLVHCKLSPRTSDFADVEDIVQETCLRAFRDIHSFTYQSPGAFMRWLSTIADHVIVDRVRYQNRARRAGDDVPFRSESNPHGPDPATSATPSRLFAQQQAVEQLLARLDALPEDARQLILMAKLEGLSTAEIAAHLGKSREAVAVLLFRAVQRFRNVLATERP